MRHVDRHAPDNAARKHLTMRLGHRLQGKTRADDRQDGVETRPLREGKRAATGLDLFVEGARSEHRASERCTFAHEGPEVELDTRMVEGTHDDDGSFRCERREVARDVRRPYELENHVHRARETRRHNRSVEATSAHNHHVIGTDRPKVSRHVFTTRRGPHLRSERACDAQRHGANSARRRVNEDALTSRDATARHERVVGGDEGFGQRTGNGKAYGLGHARTKSLVDHKRLSVRPAAHDRHDPSPHLELRAGLAHRIDDARKFQSRNVRRGPGRRRVTPQALEQVGAIHRRRHDPHAHLATHVLRLLTLDESETVDAHEFTDRHRSHGARSSRAAPRCEGLSANAPQSERTPLHERRIRARTWDAMFGWFKNKSSDDDDSTALVPVASADPDAPRDDYETALETVGSMLRSIARGAFTIEDDTAEDIAQRFEDWAQHILIQTPPPDRTLDEGDENRSFPRDWLALRRIVTDHRRREHDYVVETVGGLRGAVWAFVDSLHRVMTMVAASDKQVGSNLERLKDVARGGTPEMLQKEVMSVVREIETVIDERQKKQHSQTRDLGSRIRNVSHQLAETRSPASLDPMTRLYNRKSVEEHLHQLVELSDLFEQQISVAYFDIDGMKTINEVYGQPTGDLLLRKLADMVARAFPQRTDFAARFEGDAFVVVQNETSLKDARRLAERFMQQARIVHVKRGDREVHGTFSGGIAQLEPGESPKGLIDRTMRAARRAYDGGGDRVLEAGPAIIEPKEAS